LAAWLAAAPDALFSSPKKFAIPVILAKLPSLRPNVHTRLGNIPNLLKISADSMLFFVAQQ
jgi:hypothetical protein